MPSCTPRWSSLLALAVALAVATGCGGSDTPPGPAACVPVDDGLECTLDQCVGGLAVNDPKGLGVACSQGVGSLCDGHGACVAPACGDHVLTGLEQCDDGNTASGDGCDANCTPSACGNGVVAGGEACDDGNTADGDTCTATCQLPPACGNGILDPGEACDDAAGADGDGCSATCRLEPGATCTGQPSLCTVGEWQCSDGLDNDGEGLTDLADPDCALPAYFTPCAAGQDLLVLAASGLPAPLEGFDVLVNRSLRFDVPGTARRAVVLADVAYPFTSQIFIQLDKGGTTAVLAQYPGFGADFTGTLFDMGCSVAIGSGASPFTGCYVPQQPMPVDVPVAGAWTISVASRSTSPPAGGQVTALKLGLCVTNP